MLNDFSSVSLVLSSPYFNMASPAIILGVRIIAHQEPAIDFILRER